LNDLIKITIPFDADAWHGYGAETVWAALLPDEIGFVEIRNTPFLADGISFCDIAEVDAVDDEIVFQRVVRKSGRSTFRVVPKIADSAAFQARLGEIEASGCTWESGTFNNITIYAIDCEQPASVPAVRAALKAAETDGLLDYDEADIAPAPAA
jgi:hypothetical protein